MKDQVSGMLSGMMNGNCHQSNLMALDVLLDTNYDFDEDDVSMVCRIVQDGLCEAEVVDGLVGLLGYIGHAHDKLSQSTLYLYAKNVSSDASRFNIAFTSICTIAENVPMDNEDVVGLTTDSQFPLYSATSAYILLRGSDCGDIISTINDGLGKTIDKTDAHSSRKTDYYWRLIDKFNRKYRSSSFF